MAVEAELPMNTMRKVFAGAEVEAHFGKGFVFLMADADAGGCCWGWCCWWWEEGKWG